MTCFWREGVLTRGRSTYSDGGVRLEAVHEEVEARLAQNSRAAGGPNRRLPGRCLPGGQ